HLLPEPPGELYAHRAGEHTVPRPHQRPVHGLLGLPGICDGGHTDLCLGLRPRGEHLFRVHQARLPIGEVPIHYRVRTDSSKLKPSDGLLIAESLIVNAGSNLRLAQYNWLKKMYEHDLISGKNLYKRNIRMGEALSLKLQPN